MREFFRLIKVVLFLIGVTIFIGPLLILSAIRGQQKTGPLTFDSSHYNDAGRAGIFMLGLALWLLLWGGAALLALNILLPPAVVSSGTITITELPTNDTLQSPLSTSTPVSQTAENTATPVPTTPLSTSTPTPKNTLTPTPVLPTDTPTPAVTSTPAPPTSTPTITPLFNEALATSTSLPENSDVEVLTTPTNLVAPTVSRQLSITPQPTLTIVERNEVITAVQEGNKLLRDAVALANQDNLNNLEGVWQGKALTVVEEFATDLYNRYTQPLTVDFEYISTPVVGNPVGPGLVGVTSREKWSYGGPSEVYQEAFEFIYTLKKQNDEWIITWYSYRNLPVPVSTATPTN